MLKSKIITLAIALSFLSMQSVIAQCTITEKVVVSDGVEVNHIQNIPSHSALLVDSEKLYVLSDDDTALSVFDVSSSNMIVELGFIRDADEAGGDASSLLYGEDLILKDGKAIVAVNDDGGKAGLFVFDVSDPTMITEVGSFLDDSRGGMATNLRTPTLIEKSGDLAVVYSSSDDALSVLNISDPLNIAELGTIKDDNQGGMATKLDGVLTLSVVGSTAYVSSSSEKSLAVYDFSNPANISELGFITDDSVGGMATNINFPTGLEVVGLKAYLADASDDSLSIYDIGNPANITQLGVIRDNSVGGTATQLNGARSVDVQQDLAYVGSGDDDALSIFDVSDPANIVELTTVLDDSKGGAASGLRTPFVIVQGNRIYTGTGNETKLSIFETSGCISSSTLATASSSGRSEVSSPTITSPVNGEVLNTAFPIIKGTVGGSTTLTLINSSILVGHVRSSGGTWEFAPFEPLPDGEYKISAYVNGVKSTSGKSNTVTFTIDTSTKD